MAIQLKSIFAQSIVQKILDDVSKIKIVFVDLSEIELTNFGKDIQENQTDLYWEAVFYLSFSIAESKTIDKIQFFDSLNNLLFEDIGLNINMSAGDYTFLERIRLYYVA